MHFQWRKIGGEVRWIARGEKSMTGGREIRFGGVTLFDLLGWRSRISETEHGDRDCETVM